MCLAHGDSARLRAAVTTWLSMPTRLIPVHDCTLLSPTYGFPVVPTVMLQAACAVSSLAAHGMGATGIAVVTAVFACMAVLQRMGFECADNSTMHMIC